MDESSYSLSLTIQLTGALRALSDVLRRQLLSRDEVKQALAMALRLQAGRQVLLPSPSTTSNDSLKAMDTTPSSVMEGSNDSTSSSALSNIVEEVVDDNVSSSGLESPKRVQLVPIVLSYWSLDSAFCSLLKVPSSRLGKPVIRGE